MDFTADQLAQATGAPIRNAQMYHPHLVVACDRFEIDSRRRLAAFFATIGIEARNLTQVEEGLYYKSAERLADLYKRVFASPADAEPFVRNPRGLSELLYQGCHGRGLIQLTWPKNYERAGKALGFDYLADPSVVATPEHAALTAAWFWWENGCNEPADDGDMDRVTRIVNGPRKLHLRERKALYAIALEVLA